MSNLTSEQSQKLQDLIYSRDLETVISGLELLDTLAENESDIYDVFGMSNNIPSSPNDVRRFDCYHRDYIKVWILGKLAEYNVDWVCNLTKLYLNYNYWSRLPKLSYLPESIGNLTNLEYLDLRGNQLIILPESIENLTRLTELYLDNNRLTFLPESIGNFTLLTELYLRGNQLTILPESIGVLTNLTELYLCENQITTLPSQFFNLTKFPPKDIFLDNNPLSDETLNKIQERVIRITTCVDAE